MNNVELIRQFAEDLWDNKDFTSIDRLFAEDSVLHSPLGNLVGLKENHDGMRTWIEGMPDLGVETIDIFENENKVIWQWTAEGTHLGNFMDIPPSGNKIHYQGCSIYQFQDNKVKEYWAYVNLDMIKAQMRGDMLEGV